jgi:zinc D-Ala-D-Ala carboxypeptidase
MQYYSVTASTLNIRPTPDTMKSPVGTIAKGGLWVGTGEIAGTWVEGMTFGGVSGWVHRDFVTPATLAASPQEVRQSLTTLGWRTDTAARTTQAIKDFQAIYNLTGAPLSVTGVIGPADTVALREAVRLGRISAHFTAKEFACKCGGKFGDCRRIRSPRDVVVGAEKLRTLIGSFTPVSTYRCPGRNTSQGGYARSQHLYGLAMDIPAQLTPQRLQPLKAFSGFGINKDTGKCRHVDLRHLSPDNHPKATLSHPRIYTYG